MARLAASEAAGIEAGEDGELGVAGVEAGLGTEWSLAKHIRHFPANRGLWSGSRSRPHSKHNKLNPAGWGGGRKQDDLCKCWRDPLSGEPWRDAGVTPW